MTPTEIRDALELIRVEGSLRAYVSVSLSLSGPNSKAEVCASFYPEDIVGKHAIHANADTFEAAIAALRKKWDADKALADKNTIRKMALTIIEITTDRGKCSDAALRGAGFYQKQIDRIGALACEEATLLAAGGPFSIVPTVGANAEAA